MVHFTHSPSNVRNRFSLLNMLALGEWRQNVPFSCMRLTPLEVGPDFSSTWTTSVCSHTMRSLDSVLEGTSILKATLKCLLGRDSSILRFPVYLALLLPSSKVETC